MCSRGFTERLAESKQELAACCYFLGSRPCWRLFHGWGCLHCKCLRYWRPYLTSLRLAAGADSLREGS